MGSLLNSMSLVLEEFYNHLSVVGVSAMTGDGIDDFFRGVNEKAEEFARDYKPELERRRTEREKEKQATRQRELDKLMKDMNVGGAGGKPTPRPRKDEAETVSDAEELDMNDEEYEAELDSDDPEKGLQERYRDTIRENSTNQTDDMSFARYVQAAKFS